MAYSATDIAHKILECASEFEVEGTICNMKLQKMLYYMQGFHLAFFDKPLFDEEIEAWMYGPVVPSVYETYKSYGNSGIEFKEDATIELTQEEKSLFDEVYRVYGIYSAIGLMNLTHSETPWKSVTPGVGNVIDKEIMKQFFKQRIQ